MAVLAPEQVSFNNTPFVSSTYGPGGTQYNNINQYANTPIATANQQYLYGNPYTSNQYSMAPAQNDGGFGGILSNGSSLKSAGEFVGNGFNLPQSTFLNNAGTSLGFGPGFVNYGVQFGPTAPGSLATAGELVGPMQAGAGEAVAGSLGTSATASSVLGAAGIGALAGGFLGRIGGSTTGGSIGGGLGAGIGMAVGGPPGAIIGGLLGGIGGGFFGGKKKPTSASEFEGSLNESGGLGGFSYGAKNAGAYDNYNVSLSNEMANYMNQAKQYLGLSSYKPISIRGGVNTRHSPSGKPGFITVGDKQFGFDPEDDNSRKSAIGQAVAAMARNSGATDAQIQSMADKIAYASTPQAQTQKTMPVIPVKDNQRFADYMAKYKS